MLKIQYVLPSPLSEATQPSLPENLPLQPRRRRLRMYLVGSLTDTKVRLMVSVSVAG